MPKRIPVQIAEHQFPSINKARIYYSKILHKYVEGQIVTPSDKQEIIDLVINSGASFPIANDQICAVRGYYGKVCFARVASNKAPHYLPILHSVKRCVTADAPPEKLK